MSEVIEEESIVCRIGCLSGPNLSSEIMEGQPAATLIASSFTEVIKAGQKALKSARFQVYGDHDIIGAELAGALKNIIALAAGILGGKGLGKNIWALLITRGLSEMIHIGKAVGTEVKPFLGVAGIGDLVATASSKNSRNYKAGYRLGKGESIEDILSSSTDVIEGIKTLETIRALNQHLGITTPIVEILYRVFFKKMDLDNAIQVLVTYRYAVDVDYL
jgi:glycerol-3-phosphate dehydrogenase (NAD(P)+)